jgi:hypothetical protein
MYNIMGGLTALSKAYIIKYLMDPGMLNLGEAGGSSPYG